MAGLKIEGSLQVKGFSGKILSLEMDLNTSHLDNPVFLNPAIALHGGVSYFAIVCLSVCVCVCVRYQNI